MRHLYQILLSKQVGVLWIILILSQPGFSQIDSNYFFIRTIPIPAKTFTTDKLQQVYLVSAENEVIKFTENGEEQFRYNNNTLGELGLLETSNPMNVLLYYPDYQTIILLDRTMNPIGEFNLFELNLLQIRAIGSSNDNKVWVYDEAAFKLKKLDREGQLVLESDDLSLLLGQGPQPIQLLERDNWVYLNDPQLGVLIFDNFGQYHKQLNIKGIDYFFVLGDYFIYLQEQQLYQFHLKSLFTDPLSLPVALQSSEQINIQKNHIYILSASGLEVYGWR